MLVCEGVRCAVVVLGAHDVDSWARVFAPSTSDPRILAMYGFIVLIHRLVLAVTSTLYLGLEGRHDYWSGILGSRCSPVKSASAALTAPRLQ
jgi:hypothetical protein